MQDCIFCKIVSGEIPSDKVYEDDKVIAFMDIKPVSRGHLLIVPKVHTQDLLDTPDEELVDLMPKVRRISDAVKKALGADGLNVTTNNGAAAGQVIFHLHFHVIPRFSHDGLKSWPHHDSELATRKELAQLIMKNL